MAAWVSINMADGIWHQKYVSIVWMMSDAGRWKSMDSGSGRGR